MLSRIHLHVEERKPPAVTPGRSAAVAVFVESASALGPRQQAATVRRSSGVMRSPSSRTPRTATRNEQRGVETDVVEQLQRFQGLTQPRRMPSSMSSRDANPDTYRRTALARNGISSNTQIWWAEQGSNL